MTSNCVLPPHVCRCSVRRTHVPGSPLSMDTTMSSGQLMTGHSSTHSRMSPCNTPASADDEPGATLANSK